MYCRKSYPLSFCKICNVSVLGALWAFYITYGFSFTFTWFIINSVKILDKEGQSQEATSREIAKNLIYVFVYLLIATIFTFTTRKQLP